MKLTAYALVVAAVIGTGACGSSHAAPIAPPSGVKIQSNNMTQVSWHRHRWYPPHYWERRYWGWRPYRPYLGWGVGWGWSPYLGWDRSGWWW
ncbi:MAG TPA: hypothetical protein VEK31_09640 [Xanthobacteraceae bacterium]|nr:hypothetical protein [Xanthobacteraceae bacterium]